MMFGGGCVCGMLVGNSLFPTITPYIYIYIYSSKDGIRGRGQIYGKFKLKKT